MGRFIEAAKSPTPRMLITAGGSKKAMTSSSKYSRAAAPITDPLQPVCEWIHERIMLAYSLLSTRREMVYPAISTQEEDARLQICFLWHIFLTKNRNFYIGARQHNISKNNDTTTMHWTAYSLSFMFIVISSLFKILKQPNVLIAICTFHLLSAWNRAQP